MKRSLQIAQGALLSLFVTLHSVESFATVRHVPSRVILSSSNVDLSTSTSSATTVRDDSDVTIQERTFVTKPTGTSFLPESTIEAATKGSPIEKIKLAKDGTSAFIDVYDYAQKIRNGEMTWEDVESADMDTRLKWVGMLHRGKRTPGRFMMRCRVPNGISTSDQMRFYATTVEPYGPEQGVVDITTRANIQLRGIPLEAADAVIDGLHLLNQTCIQSALDNVRNMVGSPIAGIDEMELVDTREICNALNDLVSLDAVTNTRGNPVYGNLPRKFNIAVSGSRDDYAHTHINDIGLQPCVHATSGEMGFNIVLGGYMSIKRVAHSIDSNMWVKADRNSVITVCEAILRLFRDESNRKDRQQARLMWLVEKYGVEDFKNAIVQEVTSYNRNVIIDNTQPIDTTPFTRRELLGIHKQPQENKVRVGILVPAGRLSVSECRQLASLADTYSNGEIRLTVEQNVILPNVDEDMIPQLLSEPSLSEIGGSRLKVNPGMIEGGLVSCTGSQFCGLGLIETKQNAESIISQLEQLVSIDRPIRIHFTGCPNSCGQVQVADIGIMGGPAKKIMEDGKAMAVPGCKIFVGGQIGEESHLSLEPIKDKIPLDDLIPELVTILKEQFGATDKVVV